MFLSNGIIKMKFSKSIFIFLSSTLLLTLPNLSSATNGYFLIGFGAKSRAMGGTGVASNTGGMAAAFNPATMIESGTRFDIGGELFIPPRAVTHDSGILGYTDEQSNHDLFLVPSMGGTYQWDDKTVVGFALIGAGLKTEYNQTAGSDSCKQVNSGSVPGYSTCPPTFYNPVLTNEPGKEAGVELIQMQFVPSIAYKVHKNHTLGASIVLAGQFFRSEGLEAFEDLGFTRSEGGLTGEGFSHAFGAGYRLGWLGNFMDDRLKLGVNYSSRVWMNEFTRYRNLFAENGKFDIPENYSIGVAFDFTKSWTVAFDIQQINYSDVRSIGNPGPSVDNAVTGNLFPLCPGADKSTCKLGGDNGLGFGWTDQTIYKIGVDWAINEKWNARAGWNYAKSPIPDDQVLFNMLAPATPEHHLTFGGGYYFTDDVVLDASVMIAFVNTIKGPTAFGPGGALVEGSNASIAMGQYGLGATLGIKF
jgi:long-chain fatty acid transport protein